MNLKRFLLCMLTILGSICVHAYDAEIDGIYYNFSGTKATVTYASPDYNSYSGDVVIPQSVVYNGTTYSVTSIGDDAFYNCPGLTSVTIPSSVTSIGSCAFRTSGLTSISYARHAAGDSNGGQSGGMERRVSDARHAAGDGDGGQPPTV